MTDQTGMTEQTGTTEQTAAPPIIEEAGETTTPTVAVVQPSAAGGPPPSPRRRRLRWAGAIAVVALAVGATVAAAALLTGASATSTAARWAPADAVAFAEVRADLPGDQQAALGEFLSAFPGFADQTILDRKLDELYERLLSAATDGRQSWSADIAPWFGGQLGAAFGPLPAAAPDGDGPFGRNGRGLVIATTTDGAAAMAWVRAMAQESGKDVTTSQHAGVDVLIIGTGDRARTAAATDGVLLIGDEASVEGAIDRGGAAGLATSDRFRTAIEALPADRLSTVFVDTAAFVARLDDLTVLGTDAGRLTAMIPPWAAGSLRVEADALVGDGAVPRTERSPDVDDAASQLPGHLPKSTVILADAHAVGATALQSLREAVGPDAATQPEDLDRILTPVGGLDGLLGWVGEAGLVVLGGEMQQGLVAIPTDADAAAGLATSLKNLASIAGLDPVETEHAGTTIVTIDLSGLESLAGLAGQTGSDRFDRDLVVSYAVTDGLVVVGADRTFVEAILDTPDGDSLADDARFRDLVDRAGASHRALVWVDLDAAVSLAAEHMDAADRADFEREVRPYLEPLDAIVGVLERDGDLERSHGLVVIDEER